MEALIAVLDPDVVLRAHRRDGEPMELHGADQVARGATAAGRLAPYVRPALVNGGAGVVAFDGGKPFAVLAFSTSMTAGRQPSASSMIPNWFRACWLSSGRARRPKRDPGVVALTTR